MLSLGQLDNLLGELLNPGSYHIYSPVVGGVQLQGGLGKLLAEDLSAKSENGCGFTASRRTCEDHIWNLGLGSELPESAHYVGIANDLVEGLRPVFFQPDFLLFMNHLIIKFSLIWIQFI